MYNGYSRYENLNFEVYFGGPIEQLTIWGAYLIIIYLVNLDTDLIKDVNVTFLT